MHTFFPQGTRNCSLSHSALLQFVRLPSHFSLSLCLTVHTYVHSSKVHATAHSHTVLSFKLHAFHHTIYSLPLWQSTYFLKVHYTPSHSFTLSRTVHTLLRGVHQSITIFTLSLSRRAHTSSRCTPLQYSIHSASPSVSHSAHTSSRCTSIHHASHPVHTLRQVAVHLRTPGTLQISI
jgi:hypothetical protein